MSERESNLPPQGQLEQQRMRGNWLRFAEENKLVSEALVEEFRYHGCKVWIIHDKERDNSYGFHAYDLDGYENTAWGYKTQEDARSQAKFELDEQFGDVESK